MPREEMVILVRCFDFLTWLLPATNNFPRAHRHTLTQRLLDALQRHAHSAPSPRNF